MAFLESPRLDTRITSGAQVKVTNPGRIKIYTEDGHLTQKFTRSRPMHALDVSHGLRSAADFQTVLDLWYVVHFTPYTGFRARMQSDYVATLLNSWATLVTGSTTVLQLQRKHTYGGVTMLRDIFKPVSATVTVFRNGSAIGATVDYTTGRATISGHTSGDLYTWTGEFDLPVTFVDNEWTGSLEVSTVNLHVSSDPIKLEEILL
jgi:uncharacterized protein (TIGR02217 family)